MKKRFGPWYPSPPPSVGWWIASRADDVTAIRWWDGKVWSAVCYPYYSPEQAASRALLTTHSQRDICWKPRPATWPKRSFT